MGIEKKGASGSWGNRDGNYSISTKTGLKEYYISQTNYKGAFGTKNVLSAKSSGNARFYVMALSDASSSGWAWTEAQKFNGNGWSVPSRNEWAAFAGLLGITSSNYQSYGLQNRYWGSYINDDYSWACLFYSGRVDSVYFSDSVHVRLSTMF